MRDIALRNGTLDRNAGRNVKRSADVSGNARHFCDGELDFTRMWEKTFRGDDGSQFSRKRSERPCGLNSKGLSLCLFELNYTKIWARAQLGRKTETNPPNQPTNPTRNAGRIFYAHTKKLSPLKWKNYFAVQNCLWYIISIIQPILKEKNHDWKTQY